MNPRIESNAAGVAPPRIEGLGGDDGYVNVQLWNSMDMNKCVLNLLQLIHVI